MTKNERETIKKMLKGDGEMIELGITLLIQHISTLEECSEFLTYWSADSNITCSKRCIWIRGELAIISSWSVFYREVEQAYEYIMFNQLPKIIYEGQDKKNG